MVKPIWILLEQETVSGSGISWAVCNSAPCSRQITMPAPHHSVFLQAGCPSCRPTNSVKALKAPLLNNKEKFCMRVGGKGRGGFIPLIPHWIRHRSYRNLRLSLELEPATTTSRRNRFASVGGLHDRRLGSFACVRRRGAIAMRCKRCLNDIANRPIAIIHPRDYWPSRIAKAAEWIPLLVLLLVGDYGCWLWRRYTQPLHYRPQVTIEHE